MIQVDLADGYCVLGAADLTGLALRRSRERGADTALELDSRVLFARGRAVRQVIVCGMHAAWCKHFVNSTAFRLCSLVASQQKKR